MGLFVFTDGEVGHTKDVITEVQRHWETHRCFSFGSGAGASTALIKGIAWAAGGSAELIKGQDHTQPKNLPPRMEAALPGRGPEVIFPGQRCLIYVQLHGQPQPPGTAVGGVTLQYRIQDQTYKEMLQFPLQPQDGDRLPVHRLAAKWLLLELEGAVGARSEGDRRRALETSLSSGVVCSLTAYVGVDTERGQPVQGPLVRRDIPLSGNPGRVGDPGIGLLCGSSGPSLPPRVTPVPPAPGQEESSGHWPDKMRGSLRGLALPAGRCLSWLCCLPELIQGGLRCKGSESCKHGAPPETAPQEEWASEESSMLRLVSLQNVDGLWDLDPWLAAVLGVS
ncbi:LOW QUALITY PROTEIN: von Willebrand factor A domain-containing protein 5A-like [Dermochelys coriacea]|uniref:LOW QUALITY PROTEIN: von Willebrand factor A domain-containing protein 5A-like n=1 Tax=Dermochelys coriacea TaxID=27794 RepID=UPI001CA85636|nr:LOW QUALITY PROTEIN: von Willebrand factor A domain-containing protein 5A-like [Dermochelys coriacea]